MTNNHGWMGDRTHCANGHDLRVPANLYPQLPNRRPERRCAVCMRHWNNTRRMAYTLLGLTQREYLAQYGSSYAAALRVIRRWHEGVAA